MKTERYASILMACGSGLILSLSGCANSKTREIQLPLPDPAVLPIITNWMGLPLRATASGPSVTLAWDWDGGTNAAYLAGFRLYQGGASHSYNTNNPVDAGTNLQATIGGIVPGNVYYFAVTAYDISNQESAFSAELVYAPLPAPPPPTGLNVLGLSVLSATDPRGPWAPMPGLQNLGVSNLQSGAYYRLAIAAPAVTNTPVPPLPPGK